MNMASLNPTQASTPAGNMGLLLFYKVNEVYTMLESCGREASYKSNKEFRLGSQTLN